MLHNNLKKKNMDNLHFIPNNILIIFFKELTKYKNDYQQYLKKKKNIYIYIEELYYASYIHPSELLSTKTKGMFGNCFFPLFFISKNNFLFLKLKNLFGNPNWIKNKNYTQNSICKGN